MSGGTTTLDNLHDIPLEHILRYLSFDQISKLRIVSTRLNRVCKRLLNNGFRSVEKYHAKCLKEMKGRLPRRESERRDHPLARHCDILTAIETRISLLSMTFMKYVDHDICCFIPGKVIDEIFTVLRTIQSDKNPPRAYEVLQELRDISSMAMEYFDEKIVPWYKSKLPTLSPLRFASSSTSLPGMFSSGTGFSLSMRFCDTSPTSTPLCRIPMPRGASEPAHRAAPRSITRDMDAISKSSKKLSQRTNKIVRDLKRQADSYKNSVESQNKKILDLDKRIDQQNEIINQQNARLAEQEEKLAEMNRRLIENTVQLTDLSKEKTVLTGGTGGTTAARPGTSTGSGGGILGRPVATGPLGKDVGNRPVVTERRATAQRGEENVVGPRTESDKATVRTVGGKRKRSVDLEKEECAAQKKEKVV